MKLTDTPRTLTAAQTAAMNECSAKPGMQYNVEGGNCTPIVTAADDARELRRFCEMQAGYTWDATKTPPTCVPPPSGSTVVPEEGNSLGTAP